MILIKISLKWYRVDSPHTMVSWQWRSKGQLHPLKFLAEKNWLENFFLLKYCSPKMQNLVLYTSILAKFRGNIKILGTKNLFCQKFAVFVGKLQLPARPTFSTHNTNAAVDSPYQFRNAAHQ